MTTEIVTSAYGEWATQIHGTTLIKSNMDNYYLVSSRLYHRFYIHNDLDIDENFTIIGRDVAKAMINLGHGYSWITDERGIEELTIQPQEGAVA